MLIDFFKFNYNKDILSPFISSETISFHYEKHHKAYYDNLVSLLDNSNGFKDKSLGEIIIASYQKEDLKALYNNCAQVFNHDFYWNSLLPDTRPSDFVLDKVNKDFGSLDKFKDLLKEKGLKQFGSGWVWVVLNSKTKKMEIVSTSNADTPLTLGLEPIITIDVWEHAYYIDYRNNRAEYLTSLINNLINWNFFEANLKKLIVD